MKCRYLKIKWDQSFYSSLFEMFFSIEEMKMTTPIENLKLFVKVDDKTIVLDESATPSACPFMEGVTLFIQKLR